MILTGQVQSGAYEISATAKQDIDGLGADLPQDIRDLCAASASHSPYLLSLMRKEADWLAQAVTDQTPINQLFSDLENLPLDQMPKQLRQAKRRVALYTALCDIGGAWPLEIVTKTLTDFADLATNLALQASLAPLLRRGKLPGKDLEDLSKCGGMVVFAMGKMGAHELNYSSDIDLICLFDDSQFPYETIPEARSIFVRATRNMSTMLNDITGDGYVFRTDLRLRPDPAVTPVCLSMDAAERYYESLGRAWERAAYIKARPCAGDIAAGGAFLKTLTPFIWRKHLDFAAIQDAHDMRLRIRNSKGLAGPITLPGHHMKLGRGGIREIEFFAQTRQLIAGGRDPDLRARGTCEALEKLAQKGWVPPEAAQRLSMHYRYFRTIEHRLQMVQDAQTHILPQANDDRARLASFMGQTHTDFEKDLHARLTEVHEMMEHFFAEMRHDRTSTSQIELDTELVKICDQWTNYPALRSPRAAAQMERLRPVILQGIGKAAHPQEAMRAFDKFMTRLPAGVQIFALFESNPQLIDLMLGIMSTAPDLAQYLARNAQVLDAVIGGGFFDPWPGQAALCTALAREMREAGDYERQLDAARRWAKEWHFRIGVHLLRGLVSPREAMEQYAQLAHASLSAIWPRVIEEFSRKHGPEPGAGAVVLGMGSLGAGRLSANSDLDLVVIYDADGNAMSQGRKPLEARRYYPKLTQALITAVTASMSEGRLYEIDMRLRPSGNQGPVAISWNAFEDYQRNQAWVWEHMALSQMRVIAGPCTLGQAVTDLRDELMGKKTQDEILAQVAQMRQRIFQAKSPQGPFDVKIGPGRLQDIELLAQGGWLIGGRGMLSLPEGLAQLAKSDIISVDCCAKLSEIYQFFQDLQSATRLLSAKPLEPGALGRAGEKFLLRVAQEDALDGLLQQLDDKRQIAEEIINMALAPYANAKVATAATSEASDER